MQLYKGHVRPSLNSKVEMSSSNRLIVVAACFAVVSALELGTLSHLQTVKLPGTCSNITYTILPLEQLAGFWYRPYSTQNIRQTADCDGDCVTANIIPDTRSYKMDVCCRKGSNVKCGTSVGSGIIQYHPTALGGVYYENTVSGPASLRTEYYILDTDSLTNASYILMYACTAGDYYGSRLETATVLTREPGLTEAFITRVFEVYESVSFKTAKLIHSPQGLQCPYVKFE